MTATKINHLKGLQKIGGYQFHDASVLRQALVHRSFTNEEKGTSLQDNERLEFLGDAVLQLAISHYLIRLYPSMNEGGLSKKRSALVREESLKTAAESLKLGRYLILGRGEEASGGRTKASILAGALEAVVGAVYLDGGYDVAARVIETWLGKLLPAGMETDLLQADYKSRLQELCQSRFRQSPQYVVIAESGPDHQKAFRVAVQLKGEFKGFGRGKSKKEAEQNAARDVLLSLEAIVPYPK